MTQLGGSQPPSFFLHLMESKATEVVYFKVPDEDPFDEINSMRLTFETEIENQQKLDFKILGLDLLPDNTELLETSDFIRRNAAH